MQDDARKITYGAMMIAVFVIALVIGVFVPLLGSITIYFSPLPILLYRLRYDRKSSIIATIVGVIISLIGGLLVVPFAIFFGVLGFVIADTIRIGKSRLYTFMASGLTILILFTLTYVGTVLFLGVNILTEALDQVTKTQTQLISWMEKYGEVPERVKEQLSVSMDLALTAIPSAFIIVSFISAFVIVQLNLMVVNRLGNTVQKLPPFRMMKLPLLTVWCYLVIILIPLFTTLEKSSGLYLIVINATIIFRFLFMLQGISLIHHFMYHKKLPKWSVIVATLFALVLSQITVLLGVIDIGMNIRAWLDKEKSN